MVAKKYDLIKKNLEAAKSLAIEVTAGVLGVVLNPATWMSRETVISAFSALGSAFVAERFRRLFTDEVKPKIDLGEIDEKVLNTDKATRSIFDLLHFLGKENPDTETWNAIKKIFIRTLEKDVSERERASLYDLLEICKQLSGSEIMILAGAHDILVSLDDDNKNQRNVNWWADRIVEHIGFVAREQVLRYEENLVNQKLIVPREDYRQGTMDTWVGGGGSNGHRLTSLGRKLTQLLSE